MFYYQKDLLKVFKKRMKVIDKASKIAKKCSKNWFFNEQVILADGKNFAKGKYYSSFF